MKPIIRLNTNIKKKDNNRDNTRCFLASLNEEFIDGSQHLIKKLLHNEQLLIERKNITSTTLIFELFLSSLGHGATLLFCYKYILTINIKRLVVKTK